MKKQAIVVLSDYWHPRHTIEPVLPLLFDQGEWFVKVTEDPNVLGALTVSPDLIVNFKDGIANTQIPTQNWYDRDIAFRLPILVKMEGCGYLGVHCGLANIPDDHPAYAQVLKGRFTHHPPKCPVTLRPVAEHPVTEGVEPFTVEDEHYFVEVAQADTQVLARSVSQHGDNIAVWAHALGEGRVCGITPGHTTEVLTHPQMLKLLRNAVNWCAR